MSVTAATRPFPDFLAHAFDAGSLEGIESTIAVIEPTGRLLWRNPAWDRHAVASGEPTDDASYFDGIPPHLRDHYRRAFANALATGEVYEQVYESSSAEASRRFHLRALPIDGRLLLEHSLVAESEHDRPSGPPVEPHFVGPSGTIQQCSNCRRVRRSDLENAWHLVPQWVHRAPTGTSHVLCPLCAGFYWGRRLAR